MARVESRDWVEIHLGELGVVDGRATVPLTLDPYGRVLCIPRCAPVQRPQVLSEAPVDADRRAAQSPSKRSSRTGRRQSLPPSSRRPRPSSRSPCSPRSANSGAGPPTSSPADVVAGIAKEQVAAYRAQVAKGGTDIIERAWSRPSATAASPSPPGARSTPWLSDMATRDQEGILRIISDGQRDGMHPHQIARELRGYFDGTEHNAVHRRPHGGAETPDRRPGCDLPEDRGPLSRVHRRRRRCDATGTPRRDGKIYPIDKAPWLGEPNCRCILIDALDYRVEEEAAAVEESDSIHPNTRGTRSMTRPPTLTDRQIQIIRRTSTCSRPTS